MLLQIKISTLNKIDLLPKIRYKTLIVRDMATVFSEKQDVLEDNLGVLTRVLDGDGYQRESGAHGGRGYRGEYLFMMLAASTPLRIKVLIFISVCLTEEGKAAPPRPTIPASRITFCISDELV